MATKKEPEVEKVVEEVVPTPEEAKKMFKERPDLSSVLTTEGFKSRYD